MRLAHRTAILAAALIGALAMLALPSVAAAKDRNHDRIPDRWEKHHRLSLNVNQARHDQDGDQLRNRGEFLAGDNPRKADSDGDGIPDGEENAGKIASFDTETGVLTVALFDGETISGLVNEETEIECSQEGATASTSSEDNQDSGQEEGDQQGQEESGDEQGEDEPGDDDGPEGEPGNDEGDNSGPGNEGNCTTADLVPGAVVDEAELKLSNGTATFEKIELGS